MPFHRWRHLSVLPALVLTASAALLRAEDSKPPDPEEKAWLLRLAQEKPDDVVAALREFSALKEKLGGMPAALQAASNLLVSKDREIRKAAEAAMAAIGPRGIDALATTLRGNRRFMADFFKGGVGVVGAIGLGGGGGGAFGKREPDARSIEELVAALKSVVADERMKALGTLAARGPEAQDAVNALVEHLERCGAGPERYAERRAVLRVFRSVGPGAKDAVPALVQRLDACGKEAEGDLERIEIISVFRAIGPDAKAAVPALVRALEPFLDSVPSFNERAQADSLVRCALSALGAIGRDASGACPAIIDFLAQDNFRESARDALKDIGAPAIAALQRAFETEVTKRSLCAARTHFDLAKDELLVVPHFTRGLSSEHRPLAELSVTFLLEVKPGSPVAIRWLIDDLLTETPSRFGGTERGEFAGAKLKELGDAAVPLLADALKAHAKNEIRAACVKVLARMAPKNEKIAAALFEGLGQDDEKISVELYRALYQYRAFLAPARERLTAVLGDTREKNVENAASALYLLAVSAADFASFKPLLLKCLADERNAIRTVAAFAAGTFGAEAAPLKGTIEKMLDDPCSPVREHAALALAQLDPAAPLPEKCAHLFVDFIASDSNESLALHAVARAGLKRHGAPAVAMLIERIQVKYGTLSEKDIAARIEKWKKENSKPPVVETTLGKSMFICGVEFIEYEIERNGEPVK